MVTGVDLVAEQLRIAAGEPLRLAPGRTSRRAAARSSCGSTPRIPANDFMPSPGPVGRCSCPPGRGCACDTWLEAGGEVAAVLRLAAGQGDRVGPTTATTAIAPRPARARRDRGRGRQDHRAAARRRCWTRTGSRPATSTPARSRRGSRTRRGAREHDHRRGTGARYSWGGDEHLFVELAEEMSLQANFRAMAIVSALRERRPDGRARHLPRQRLATRCASTPTCSSPTRSSACCASSRREVGDAHDFELETRIVEIPVLYHDPWTHETLMRFRDRHQDPDGTDLEYAARINGFDDVEAFIDAHAGSPWFASMVGFVAGLPFLFQMVPRERQLEVPKYLRPRTDTPALTVGHGGCFGCIYSVRGAGGYQMFGITPLADLRPRARSCRTSRTSCCFFGPGDIVKFGPIDRERYDELRARRRGGHDLASAQRPVDVQPRGVPRRPRRLQPPAAGGAPCRLRCSSPGSSTTVQDRGREGYYHVGIPPSGALDQYSLRRREPARRQRRGRGRARVRLHGAASCGSPSAAVVAVTGAELEPRVNGEAQPGWTSFAVAGGRRPHVRLPQGAARARTSRWPAGSTCRRRSAAAPPTRSARSAAWRAARCRRATSSRSARARTGPRGAPSPRTLRPALPKEVEVRVVMGLYDHLLTDEGRADVPRDDVDAHAGRRPHRLPLQGRRAGDGRARAAVRRGQRPVEHRRRAVPDRLDPGAGRRRADHPAPRRGLRRRLRDDRDRDQRPTWTPSAQSAPGSTTRFVEVDLDAALAARHERREREDRLRAALA